jgi:hypothetical protein
LTTCSGQGIGFLLSVKDCFLWYSFSTIWEGGKRETLVIKGEAARITKINKASPSCQPHTHTHEESDSRLKFILKQKHKSE